MGRMRVWTRRERAKSQEHPCFAKGTETPAAWWQDRRQGWRRETASRGWVSYDQGSEAADSRLVATISLSCSTVSGLGGQAGRLVNPILVHSPASASSLRRARPFRSLFLRTLTVSLTLRFAHRRYTRVHVSFYRRPRSFPRFLGIIENP